MAAITQEIAAESIGRDEALKVFDAAARRFVNMSGLEFLDAWSAGRFGDPDALPGVMEVASLIPLLAR